MKIAVSPANGRIVPSSPAALSSSRSAVVPTATMRPPCARVVVQRVRRLRVTVPHSAMHPVPVGVLGLHRQEGAGADMQRHACSATPRASSRSSSSSVKCRPAVGAATEPSSLREHGLVVAAVRVVGGAPRGDIGRQRHVAALGDGLIQHRAVEREGERHLAALALFLHRRVELAEEADPALVAEAHDVARREPLCRPHEGAPARAVEPPCSVASIRGCLAAPEPPAGQPRRDDLGVVDHQRVAGPQQVRQIAHAAVLEFRLPPGRTTSSRAASRGETGRNAMRSGGSSKSNRIGAHAVIRFPGIDARREES